MTRLRWLLAAPAILLAASGTAPAAEIRDKGGMFSAEAVARAQAELERIEGAYSVPVTIETVESLNGRNIDDLLLDHARAVNAKGLYILMARRDHKIEADTSREFAKYLNKDRDRAIRDTFTAEFRKGDFDAGLARGVAKIDGTFAEAKAEAGGSLRAAPVAAGRRVAQGPVPVRRVPNANGGSWGMGSLLMIGLGIFGVFLVLRILGALFSGNRGGYGNQARMGGPGGFGGPGGAPGYGGGYGGGGGGGFMSSMFGGIGGALAGNWLYDQFSGRQHGTMDQTSYDPGAAPVQDAGPDYVGPNDGGGDWGAGGGDAGGGGGDWGGGGGGGDWGGGGGGDWGGGGGDNGGGW